MKYYFHSQPSVLGLSMHRHHLNRQNAILFALDKKELRASITILYSKYENDVRKHYEGNSNSSSMKEKPQVED